MIEIVPLQLGHAAAREEAITELWHDPYSKYIADNIKLRANNISWLEHALATNLEQGATRYYGIFCYQRKMFAGEIGVDAVDLATNSANVFYWVRPSLRNQGIAFQAIELLRKEEFLKNIKSLKFMVDKSNFLSERVLRKVGAVMDSRKLSEDKLRNYYYVDL